MTEDKQVPLTQTLVGAGVVLLGLAMAAGAVTIKSEAGYAGVGPNFLPWVVSIVLVICGGFIVFEARTGGFRELDEPSGAASGWWPGLVWVSAGLLANAALITTIGFILACTLCYLLAVQGLRRSQGQAGVMSARTLGIDVFTGFAIAAPVYWMFTQFLAINLPGLTNSGWI
ncbi:tripartite tricarboxylate transporter TctB family protein [Ramlibacter albus]|uniref:Tripartite tricarboxylate transporter TctB family protein n=1 Tax=Ramlibacter albus TaxID=2079448 RepID=A0A923S8N9_9BURK|nr:tripartite tricarboxylate transporter TctB family protein [Ramlibacter albus]MBC5768277.1 tripartite tricarboxylate transporter TctB family protein [Ramlibacter albus]